MYGWFFNNWLYDCLTQHLSISIANAKTVKFPSKRHKLYDKQINASNYSLGTKPSLLKTRVFFHSLQHNLALPSSRDFPHISMYHTYIMTSATAHQNKCKNIKHNYFLSVAAVRGENEVWKNIWPYRTQYIWQDKLPQKLSCVILSILMTIQDCIPVWCIPPACCPYLPACTALGVGGLLKGVSGSGGVCIPACNGADPPPCEQNHRKV